MRRLGAVVPKRGLLAFLCRGWSPQDRVFRLSFKGSSCFGLPVFRPVALFTPRRRGYFPFRSFWVHRFNDPIMGAGPSLHQRVSTFPKRRATPVPSLCLLKVVAARVVAQLFSLTLPWICRCSVRKTCLVSSGCSLLVRILWLVLQVSFPSLLSCLSSLVSSP